MRSRATSTTPEGRFDPNYDMFEWGWYNDLDPGIAARLLHDQPDRRVERLRLVGPAYDATYKAQSTEMDVAKRLQDSSRVQEIIYQQSPYIPLAYSYATEAWNTSRWTGWVQYRPGWATSSSPPMATRLLLRQPYDRW